MRKVIIVAGLILFMVIGRSHGQEKEFYNAPLLGVKTNTLYWLTTTINIGAEIGLGKNTTIDLLGTYNPWSFGDNKKIKHWLVQPEFRYWTCERFNGHFWGLQRLQKIKGEVHFYTEGGDVFVQTQDDFVTIYGKANLIFTGDMDV